MRINNLQPDKVDIAKEMEKIRRVKTCITCGKVYNPLIIKSAPTKNMIAEPPKKNYQLAVRRSKNITTHLAPDKLQRKLHLPRSR